MRARQVRRVGKVRVTLSNLIVSNLIVESDAIPDAVRLLLARRIIRNIVSPILNRTTNCCSFANTPIRA